MSNKASNLFNRYVGVICFSVAVKRPINYHDLTNSFDDMNKQTAAFCLAELEKAGYLSSVKGGKGRGNISSYKATDLFFKNLIGNLGLTLLNTEVSRVSKVKVCDAKTVEDAIKRIEQKGVLE